MKRLLRWLTSWKDRKPYLHHDFKLLESEYHESMEWKGDIIPCTLMVCSNCFVVIARSMVGTTIVMRRIHRGTTVCWWGDDPSYE